MAIHRNGDVKRHTRVKAQRMHNVEPFIEQRSVGADALREIQLERVHSEIEDGGRVVGPGASAWQDCPNVGLYVSLHAS